MDDRVVFHSFIVTTNQYSIDLLKISNEEKEKTSELDGIPKLSVRDATPISMELKFRIYKTTKLLIRTRTSRYQDGTASVDIIHSYFESLGTFEAMPIDQRASLKEVSLNLANPLIKSILCKTFVSVSDSSGKELLRLEFYLSLKKISILTMLSQEETPNPVKREKEKEKEKEKEREREKEKDREYSREFSFDKREVRLSKTPIQKPEAMVTHWSVVQKQQLPVESSKKIVSLIENDNSSFSSSESRSDRKSTGEFVKELGYWLYSTNVGQYFLKFNDEKARLGEIKEVFAMTPIWMLGTGYSFPVDDDLDEEKKSIRMPLAADKSKSILTLPQSDEPKKKTKRSRSVSLPKMNKPIHHTILRYGSLGDAYSIREVRRFNHMIMPPEINRIRAWLESQSFQVNWSNDLNIELEDQGKSSVVKNFLYIRFYIDPNPISIETIIDVNLFANFKKSSISFYLQPIFELIRPRIAKMLRILSQLTEKLETLCGRSEIVFSEGYNVDIALQPDASDDFDPREEETKEDLPESYLIEGTLELLSEEDPDNPVWSVAKIRLEEGTFSFTHPGDKEGSSIPIRMATVQLRSAQLSLDINFNGALYTFKANSEQEYRKWFEVLRREAGLHDYDEEASLSSDFSTTALKTDSPVLVEKEEKSPFNLVEDGDIVVISQNKEFQDLSEDPNHQQILTNFLQDFQSRFWFTYRKDFPKIEPSSFASDVGWGCMLRTAQMLLAQAFTTSLLSRDWRIHHQQTEEELAIYRHILVWFADTNDIDSYYSLHLMAKTGRKLDKKIGEWFGPCTAAYVLRRLSAFHKGCPLTFYVNQDQAIYCDLLIKQAIVDSTWKHVLVLLPVRLGVDHLNPLYYEPLKKLFTIPQFLGIAGGKPCKSLYFVATQGEELFYLDPHIVRPYCNVHAEQLFPVESYHCDTVRKAHISQLDPSMLLAFLIKSADDLKDFEKRAKEITTSTEPIFTIQETAPKYAANMYIDELNALGLGKHMRR